MLEVTVKLSVSVIIGSKIERTATGVRRMKVPCLPRRGETLVIEYLYANQERGHLTPVVRDVAYVFPWSAHGTLDEIILDCSSQYPCKELAIFEKGVELWREAGFDVTIKETEDDF